MHEDYVGVQVEMEVETHNFQQPTEVRWLSMGPSMKRILEQWDAIIKFVTETVKDQKEVPKSINFKRVYMMLGTKGFNQSYNWNFSTISFHCLKSFYYYFRKAVLLCTFCMTAYVTFLSKS